MPNVTNPSIKFPILHTRTDKSIQDNAYFDSIRASIVSIASFLMPGPFPNDAAAAAAGVPVGGPYYNSSGTIAHRAV